MSLYLTDKLGPRVDSRTGRWVPNSETYIEGQAAALAQTRILVAQISDLYLVRWHLQVTSAATLGRVIPKAHYFTYGTGPGKAVTQVGDGMGAASADFTSSSWMMIRAASSDIFISTEMLANGALPVVNLYVSVSRPS